MRRRSLTLISLLLSLMFSVYGYVKVSEIRNRVVREYMRHKEFLFLLRNTEPFRTASEGELRDVLNGLGASVEKIETVGDGIEVVIREVSWRKLPIIIKRVEERFRIVFFEAVDNTGKGLFRVRVVVR